MPPATEQGDATRTRRTNLIPGKHGFSVDRPMKVKGSDRTFSGVGSVAVASGEALDRLL